MRALILLILIGGLILLFSPFVIASLYVDRYGITIPGRVYAKSETVTVIYSAWKRSLEATIEYSAPDESGVSFVKAPLEPEHYDALRTGQTVSLHYLRRQDIPTVPFSRVLREMHALPTARLADHRMFSGLEMSFAGTSLVACESIAGIVILLFIWRKARWRGFWWALGICCVLGVTALLIHEFPTPMPRPAVDVRRAAGRVKSVGRIDRLFEGAHERGVVADQPVDVVGIEFVPAGRTELVVAVDLIDAGSLPGLKENSTVAIEYEGQSPRTAYIQAATRKFVSRNLAGIAIAGVLGLIVLIAFFALTQFAGRAWNRLIQKR